MEKERKNTSFFEVEALRDICDIKNNYGRKISHKIEKVQRYAKPEEVKELERMAYKADRIKYPTIPYIAPRKFRDDSTNGLTSCITAYLSLKGAFVSRLNNTGIYDQKLQKYRIGTSRKGLPDILCTYKGKSLFIEVKFDKDQMSDYQRTIQAEQIASGGIYYVARNFADFKGWFTDINF